jgi:hypothetical protein
LKEAGGRRQEAGGFFQKEIQTPPEKEPPNLQFGGGFKPKFPPVTGTEQEAVFLLPSASCPLPFLIK